MYQGDPLGGTTQRIALRPAWFLLTIWSLSAVAILFIGAIGWAGVGPSRDAMLETLESWRARYSGLDERPTI